MATHQSTVDLLLDQLAGVGNITARKMFGEYCIYLDGTPVGLVCDDRLFLKSTLAGRRLVPDAPEQPPFPGAKPYLLIAVDESEGWAEREALVRLVRATLDELPPPKSRKRPASPKRRG